MKQFKRIGALVLALVMVLAMSSTAFAEGTLTGGVDGDGSTAVTSLTFSKQIKAFNSENNYRVRLPKITYTYTITPVTVDTTAPVVTDSNDHSAAVLSGVDPTAIFQVASGVTIVNASASFGPIEDGVTVTDTTNGTLSTAKAVTFNVRETLGDAVTRAGIYRYQVEESTDITKAAAGITQPNDYSTKKYLDVYVANVNTAATVEDPEYVLKVVGFVLFDSDNASTQDIPGTDPNAAQKSDGWGEGEGTSATATDIDEYHTYNLTVRKTTTGGLADKTHQFPIALTMAKATGLENDVPVDVVVSSGSTVGTLPSGTIGSTSVDALSSGTYNASLKDGGTMVIKGIPCYTGATPAYATFSALTEKNDTVDTYNVSVTTTSITGIAAPNPASVAGGGASAAATSFNLTNAAINAAADAGISITNTMDTVSPTGVVLRVAPYALILAAGIVLLVIVARRRKQEEEA